MSGFCLGSLFCGVVLDVLSSLAIILVMKRELIALLNPFMPSALPKVFPILINWTSPFSILGLLGGTFSFLFKYKKTRL